MSRSRRTVSGVALVVATALLFLTIAPAALAGSQVKWVTHGKPVAPTAAAKYRVQGCASVNGAILVWEEGAPTPQLRAARLWDSGAVAWNVAVTSGVAGRQQNAQICADGSGGAYIVWEDYRSGAGSDIYLQHLNSSGSIGTWPAAGVQVSTGPAGTDQLVPRILQNGLSGCIISWNDRRSGAGMPYTKKYNAAGVAQWSEIPLCTSAASMGASDTVEIAMDGSGGAFFTWPDFRNVNEDIYANKVDSAGTIYTGDGEVICTQSTIQFDPQITFSVMGGAIIAWVDIRNGHNDIYAQRVDADFARYWGTNGMPVCVNDVNKSNPQICSDLQNGAILTWQDNTPTGDIRAQRLDVNGVVRWASEGVSVCTGAFNKYFPLIVNDNFGGAVLCWYDNRSGHYTVYLQKLDAGGNTLDVQNGVALSDPALDMSSRPALTGDGLNGGIATWIRSDQFLMAQRVDYDYTYYLAEGNTRTGFAEYVCLGNPTANTVNATVTCIFNDGSPSVYQDLTVDPTSRTTIFVPSLAGAGNAEKDVSIQVTADRQLICERPMYFNYGGSWTGGHDAVAATSPSQTWYFAEGNTLPGFEEWVCVLNTGNAQADLTFTFQDQVAGAITRTGTVPAGRRASFRINDLLGAGYQASLKLDSTQPLVAERPMYFSYLGMGGSNNWTGGHCVTGATFLQRAYYFAEGTTRFASNALFEEWLTLQNPGGTDITVDASYQLESGAPVSRSYPVPANTRLTIFVPTEVGFQHDVSVKLTSTADFLAERPMYFDYLAYGTDWTGGSCVIGAAAPGNLWCFGEGATIANFHEYLTLQNPDATDASVVITYYPQGDSPIVKPAFTVLANSRQTVFVNSDAGQDMQLSASVKVTSGPEIIVERPMYFNYGGWTGGHDAVGGYVFIPS